MDKNNRLFAHATKLFDTLPWPAPEDEAWRRTDLARLLPKGILDERSVASGGKGMSEVEEKHAPMLPGNYAARIITEAGRPVAMALSEEASAAGLTVSWVEHDHIPDRLDAMGHEELNQRRDRIVAWHWRDLPGALVLKLSGNQRISLPIVIEEHLIAKGDETSMFTAPHLHVEAGNHADLNIVWSFESAPMQDVHPVVNAGLTCLSNTDSVIRMTLRQNLSKKVVFFLSGRLQVGRDGRADFIESHHGGALVKTMTQAILMGEGAEARLKGLYTADADQHIDIGILQDHRCPQAISNALYKGAVHTGGRSIFQGLIKVHPGAEKTDAYLMNKNLILADGARADSIPQLNIRTDDVKCSHGSVTGKLDEGQLFYLQSRGYSPNESAREVTQGFLAEVLDGAHKTVVEILIRDIEDTLGEEEWGDG